MEQLGKKTWLLVLAALFLILLPGINHGVWRPDEPYMVGICSEMARTHDFAVPKLNGHPFLEKPPLYYWVAALSGMLFGERSDVSYRLASTFFSVLTLAVVFFGIRKRSGDLTAVMACLVLSSMWMFFDQSRWIVVDISLIFGIAVSMIAWFRITHEGVWTDSVMLGIGASVAFMAKGFVGPAMIASAIAIDILRSFNFRLILRARPHIAFIFFVLPIGIWIALLHESGGWPFVREVIIVNNIMRFTGAPEGAALGHMHGPLYYLPKLPNEVIPWTLVAIPAFVASFKNFRKDSYLPWFVGPLLLLTLSSAKRGLYLAPLGPAVACIIASWLSGAPKARWEGMMIKITWVFAILGAAAPFAGVFLGHPFSALAAGAAATAALVYIHKNPTLKMTNLGLCISVCICMASAMFIFYLYQQPREDFLPFAKNAILKVKNSEIILLDDDEVFEGILPMLTGQRYENVKGPENIKKEGYYIWSDSKRDTTLRKARKLHRVDIIMDKRIGSKNGRLAYIVPNPASSQDMTK